MPAVRGRSGKTTFRKGWRRSCTFVRCIRRIPASGTSSGRFRPTRPASSPSTSTGFSPSTAFAFASRLSAQRPADMPPLNILIEVNIDGEETKSGMAPSEVEAFADEIAGYPGLKLRGLMAIPAPAADSESRRRPLAAMRALFERLRVKHPGMDTLSMGMSADMDEAVSEGATMVRVGRAVFGPRDYSAKCAV